MKASNDYTASLKMPLGFNLKQTLECGQCFRFVEIEDGVFCGVVNGRKLNFTVQDETLYINCDQDFADKFVSSYLNFDEDYHAINSVLSKDKTLKSAIEYAGGIRILRQEPWETLCSFIISQNIKRIAGIIDRLCENFGDDIGNGDFSFPTAQKLSSLSVEDLAPLRSGFRAKYIIDAAKKVYSGEVNFDEIEKADLDSAREMLMKISGVGPKVADCVLLFGFHKLDAFPKDVWIKRIMEKYYPDGLPEFAIKYGGIAQQYLFHYIRTAESVNND